MAAVSEEFTQVESVPSLQVVNCAFELDCCFEGEGIEYCHLGLQDNPMTGPPLLPELLKATAFIDQALEQQQGADGGGGGDGATTSRVLVHCAGGASRSGAVVVGYVFMQRLASSSSSSSKDDDDDEDDTKAMTTMTVDSALKFVQSKRPVRR